MQEPFGGREHKRGNAWCLILCGKILGDRSPKDRGRLHRISNQGELKGPYRQCLTKTRLVGGAREPRRLMEEARHLKTPSKPSGVLVPKLLEGGGVLPPTLEYLHRDFQVHRALEEFLDVHPGGSGQLLEGGPTLAKKDAAVGLSLNNDVHGDEVLPLSPLLELHHVNLAGVGHFLLILQEELFPENLRHEEPFWLLAQLLLGV
mmetsp:Transcript_25233/g.70585  ORF Transcript_25233/g.70585 Transcript_25233/m.70585 type:complete len:204 (-) Transcript_25233:801-1412(-)